MCVCKYATATWPQEGVAAMSQKWGPPCVHSEIMTNHMMYRNLVFRHVYVHFA